MECCVTNVWSWLFLVSGGSRFDYVHVKELFARLA